jgi:hypothetical protein
MKKPIVFVKEKCIECNRLKKLVPDLAERADVYDIESIDGMAEAAMYEVYGNGRSIPIAIFFKEGGSYTVTTVEDIRLGMAAL